MYLQTHIVPQHIPEPPVFSSRKVKNFEVTLAQNYPNPFSDSTIIRYSLGQDAEITLTVNDDMGKEIRTIDSAKKSSGVHSVGFESKELPPGKYFYRLTALFPDGTMTVKTKKMQILR